MADPSGKTDKELMTLFLQGDAAGFEGILARYKKPVYNLLLRMIGDRTRAEDVFQDVFLAVLREMARFEGDGPMRNWILQIAVNLCRSEIRAARPKAAENPDSLAAAGAGPPAEAEKAELEDLLRKGVADLSPEHREVFILRMYHGLKYSEIGDVLNISEGTAKSRIHYAVTQLRRQLRKHVRE